MSKNSFLRTSGGLIGILILLAILVSANIIVSNTKLRLDLTENKLYSLSDGTRNILKNLEQNIELKLFFSRSSADTPVYLKNYASRVEDLLQEYKLAGNRKIKFIKYDPKPDSDAEEWAQRYGITGQPVQMMGAPVYLGLAVVSGSNEEVLPSLSPQNEHMLEYQITRMIYRIDHPEKPAIGVISTLPVMGMQMPQQNPMQRPQSIPAWLAFQDIESDFNLQQVSPMDGEIDPNLNALIIVHPKELPDKALYAIDQYLLGGGHLLVFVDPMCFADRMMSQQNNPNPYMPPQTSSNMEKLFSAWGVTFDAENVVADLGSASNIRGPNNTVEKNPVWLSLSAERNNMADDILTSDLNMINLPFAGSLKAESTDDLKVIPLFKSSKTVGTVSSMSAQYDTGMGIRQRLVESGTPVNLAVRLSGKFKTSFPDGNPDKKEEEKNKDGEDKPENKIAASKGLQEGKSTVIIVGDVDMLFDSFCAEEFNFLGSRAMRPLNNNLNFFASAVEQITGSSDLIKIRSRSKFHRPFTRVEDLEEKAAELWKEKESGLIQKLRSTQEKLNNMQAEKDESQRFIISPEQKEAIEKFRKEERAINKELKDVRKSLRKDVEVLGVKVKTINIGLMPLLVCLAGITFGIYRRNKR
jgi:ABC-type uncharacterized transport system involved in gliding motility auxiliary subunit